MLLIVCIIVVVAEPEITLFSIFAVYVLSGPVNLLVLLWKRRVVKRPSQEQTTPLP